MEPVLASLSLSSHPKNDRIFNPRSRHHELIVRSRKANPAHSILRIALPTRDRTHQLTVRAIATIAANFTAIPQLPTVIL